MTDTPPMTSRRKSLIWGGAIVAAIAVAAMIWFLVGGRGEGGSTPSPSVSTTPSASASPSTTPDDSASPAPSTPEESNGPVAPEAEPVAPDEVVVAPGDVTIALGRIEGVNGEAVTPGEVSGPAVRVTVDISNGGDEPLDLGYLVVNGYYGASRTPSSTFTRPGGQPFSGALAPGESAQGVYLFSVPLAESGDVTITVDYKIGESTVVFRGPVE